MIALYMDENVRGAITRGARLRGIDVLTAQEDGAEGRPDPQVLDRATELGRVLFTHDDDLLRVAAERQRQGVPFSGVLYARQLEVTVRQCLDDLEVIAFAGRPEEFENQVRYLPLR
jgi:predicted nuclease of predicted toxin-antitoxin system